MTSSPRRTSRYSQVPTGSLYIRGDRDPSDATVAFKKQPPDKEDPCYKRSFFADDKNWQEAPGENPSWIRDPNALVTLIDPDPDVDPE